MSYPTFCFAKDGQAAAQLVSPPIFQRAADILASYLEKITGGAFEVTETLTSGPAVSFITEDHGHSGFAYRIDNEGTLLIASNGEQQAVYAVYDLLERLIGCRYYTPTYEFVPTLATLAIEVADYSFSPILEFREVYYQAFEDKAFAEKHKMDAAHAHEGWGFWCHSFDTLLPPDEHFKEHPEYYALYKGERTAVNAEPCLSNPAVFDIMVDNLQKHIDATPAARYWSVSQNDNNAYCSCPECAALDEAEGTPMGSVLNFVNKVAAKFPEKTISTLAYWYTRKPPRTIRPADNVHIMLCNIEASRGLPIETDERNKDSKDELLAWKEICGNVFLWDYCIQFANLVSPFPNLRVLGPNIRFFVENNVRSLFSQANREVGGEFSDLRGYMLAKLMWDPYCDEREVMKDFLNGYYQEAAPYLLNYIDLLHDEMEKAGGYLNIFGHPTEVKDTYLSKELFTIYSALFDQAEKAVADKADILDHVKTARLPIYYTGIRNQYGSKEDQIEMMQKFATQARATGLEKVEEWKITVNQFITDSLLALEN